MYVVSDILGLCCEFTQFVLRRELKCAALSFKSLDLFFVHLNHGDHLNVRMETRFATFRWFGYKCQI